MKQLRKEDGLESDEDDESKWEGWDLESDSTESSDDEDWIDVDSDSGKDIVFSDSDDGDDKEEKRSPSEVQASQSSRHSMLATTKVKISHTFCTKC